MIIPEVIPDIAMLKPVEVAALFAVPRGKIYEWIKYGKMRAVKMHETVRIPRAAILEFIPTNGKEFLYSGKKVTANRVVACLRGRIVKAVKGNMKTATSMKLLGCPLDEFRAHIEKRFLPGMSWDNYGRDGWVIDHIIPCAQFDLSDPDHQRVCFHYTNLQPMWFIDNLKKGKKYTRRNIRKVISISNALA